MNKWRDISTDDYTGYTDGELWDLVHISVKAYQNGVSYLNVMDTMFGYPQDRLPVQMAMGLIEAERKSRLEEKFHPSANQTVGFWLIRLCTLLGLAGAGMWLYADLAQQLLWLFIGGSVMFMAWIGILGAAILLFFG